MIALLCFFLTLCVSPFKSKSRLEAENAALRHQLIVLQRRGRGRVHLTNGDRLFLVQRYRWFGSQGYHDHPARDPRALASRRLPSVAWPTAARAQQEEATDHRVLGCRRAFELKRLDNRVR